MSQIASVYWVESPVPMRLVPRPQVPQERDLSLGSSVHWVQEKLHFCGHHHLVPDQVDPEWGGDDRVGWGLCFPPKLPFCTAVFGSCL